MANNKAKVVKSSITDSPFNIDTNPFDISPKPDSRQSSKDTKPDDKGMSTRYGKGSKSSSTYGSFDPEKGFVAPKSAVLDTEKIKEAQRKQAESEEQSRRDSIVGVMRASEEKYVPTVEEGTQSSGQLESRERFVRQTESEKLKAEERKATKLQKQLQSRIDYAEKTQNIVAGDQIEGVTTNEPYIEIASGKFVPLSEYETYKEKVKQVGTVKQQITEEREGVYDKQVSLTEEKPVRRFGLSSTEPIEETPAPATQLLVGVGEAGQEFIGGYFDRFFGEQAMRGAEQMGILEAPSKFAVSGLRATATMPTDIIGAVGEASSIFNPTVKRDIYGTKAEFEMKQRELTASGEYILSNPSQVLGSMVVPSLLTFAGSSLISKIKSAQVPKLKTIVSKGKTAGLYAGDDVISASQRQLEFTYTRGLRNKLYRGSGYIDAGGYTSKGGSLGAGDVGFIFDPKPVSPSIIDKIKNFFGRSKITTQGDTSFTFTSKTSATNIPKEVPLVDVSGSRSYGFRTLTDPSDLRTVGFVTIDASGDVVPFTSSSQFGAPKVYPLSEGGFVTGAPRYVKTMPVVVDDVVMSPENIRAISVSKLSDDVVDIADVSLTKSQDITDMNRITIIDDTKLPTTKPKFEDLVKSETYRKQFLSDLRDIYNPTKTTKPVTKPQGGALANNLKTKTIKTSNTFTPAEVSAGLRVLKSEIAKVGKTAKTKLFSLGRPQKMSTMGGGKNEKVVSPKVNMKVGQSSVQKVEQVTVTKPKVRTITPQTTSGGLVVDQSSIRQTKTKTITATKDISINKQITQTEFDTGLRELRIPQPVLQTQYGQSTVTIPATPTPSITTGGQPSGALKLNATIKSVIRKKRKNKLKVYTPKSKKSPKADLLSVTATEWEFQRAKNPIKTTRRKSIIGTTPTMQMTKRSLTGTAKRFSKQKFF